MRWTGCRGGKILSFVLPPRSWISQGSPWLGESTMSIFCTNSTKRSTTFSLVPTMRLCRYPADDTYDGTFRACEHTLHCQARRDDDVVLQTSQLPTSSVVFSMTCHFPQLEHLPKYNTRQRPRPLRHDKLIHEALLRISRGISGRFYRHFLRHQKLSSTINPHQRRTCPCSVR